MKSSFRIICLKNEDSRKFNGQKGRRGNILPSFQKQQNSSIPNLVHLSARLQDDVWEDSKIHIQLYNRSEQDNSISQVILNNDAAKIYQQEKIKHYSKIKNLSQKYQNTITNLLGPITHTSNAKRQGKISRLIKQTIRDVCASEKKAKKFKQQNAPTLQNRVLLQSDFECFLKDKSQQKIKIVEDNEQFKLKRLSNFNPQQPAVRSARTPKSEYFNLYHFLNEKNRQKEAFRQRNYSSSKVRGQSLVKARMEKKIFNLSSALKTEEQEFGWSRIKANRNPTFTFKTINS